jgi:virginiamycin A acetyltransferase
MENEHLLQTGRGTYVDRGEMTIMSWKDDYKVIIGKYCSIARNCTFLLAADHRPDWVTTSTMLHGPVDKRIEDHLHYIGHNACKGNIIIGNDVWIGTQAIIMAGVRIGDGAVIAAGSVVTKHVAPYSVVGGNPASLLYYRFPPEIVEELQEIAWWDWSPTLIKRSSTILWNNKIDRFILYAKSLNDKEPITVVRTEQGGTKVFLVNWTNDIIHIDAKFVNSETDEVQYNIPVEMVPEVEYWVQAPHSLEGRYIRLVEQGSNKILNKTEL